VAVTDEAIEKIKERIVSGVLHPGDRLPREADLAADLGISRNSLREAVGALSLMNILDVRQGDGTYVSSLKPNLLLEALSFILECRQDDSVLHFLEVRRILEPYSAAMAAARITSAEVSELRQHTAAVSSDTPIDDLVQYDLEFHARVAMCSGNPVLAALIKNMSGATTRVRIWRGVTQADTLTRTISEHSAIIDALADGEPEIASARTVVHIAGVEEWLRLALLTDRRN